MVELAALAVDLPEPTAELVLFRVQMEALMVVLGPKQSRLLLRLMAKTLAEEENLASVMAIKPGAHWQQARAALKQAAAAFSLCLPIWLARLPVK